MKLQAVSTGRGFLPQSLAPAEPDAFLGPVAERVEGQNHLFESFARKCLEASCPLGWVLSWLLPLIL